MPSNPLTDLIPAKYRKYVYAAIGLAAAVLGALVASGVSLPRWAEVTSAVVAAVTAALAHGNTSGD